MRQKEVWGEPPGRRSGVRYDWEAIVKTLREGYERDPEAWNLTLADVPVSVASAIRMRRMSAVDLDDGEVKVRVRNSRVENGKRRGDLWMKFEPSS